MSALTPKEALHARVANDYAAYLPKSFDVKQFIDGIAADFEQLAHTIIHNCPLGRELSLALTDLESAKRNAIAAIVCHQDD